MRRISYAWIAAVGMLALLASPAAGAKKGPDLTVKALSVSGSPAPGQPLTAVVTVANAGKAKAKASQTVFTLSRDAKSSRDDRRLGARSIKTLAARARSKATVRLTVPAGTPVGAYRVIACADAGRKLRESSERNNCRVSGAVNVISPVFDPGTPPSPGGGGTPPPGPQPTPTPAPTPTPPADTAAPETTITAGPEANNDLPTATLEFAASEPGATFQCRLDAGAWEACASGKGYTGLGDGEHAFAVRATDAAGNTDASPAGRTWVKFPAPPLPLPENAEDVAPDPSVTESTIVAESTEFLYGASGDTIQDLVAEEEMEPRQIAVLRGRVLGPDGTGMPQARVSVLDHPEYGYTTTREDGGYDLAVNGGEELTLRFEQGAFEGEQYASVQRTESVPWQDFVDLDDVQLTAYTDEVTEIVERADEVQVASSEVTPEDDADPRTATLMFDPGTDATMELPNGQTKPLDDLEVRATEYTAGEAGDERMPGELPPSSAYTYAVEFSVDEAVEQGATDVKFNKPVTTYVDNFLKFQAGTIVPSAYYDEAEGAWVPSENGIVIDVLREEAGQAVLDVDGDGAADTGAALTDLGIDDVELQKLAEQYTAPTSLWRVKVRHFTPWDYNWPYGCKANCDPPDEEPPPPPYCPECQGAGSIVGLFNQTLGERVELTGSPFALHYESGRVRGYQEAYRLEIPLTGPSIRDSLRRVELEVTVAGAVHRQTFPADENLKHTFVWNGLDAYGRRLEGAQNATVRIGYVYPAEYLEPDEFEASFGQFGGRPVTRAEGNDETRREIISWQEWERPVGTLGAGSDAMGGWTLDVHHAYDPQARVLHLGDGSRVTTEAIRSELRTVAGRDPYRWWDEGTPATRTDLGVARGMDVGADGSVYVAQTEENQVVRVTPEGELEVVAGGFLQAEDLGDGGPATQARLLGPRDVAVAPDGTLYIADTGNARIRRVAPDGTIDTFAGGGDPELRGDAGPATSASLRDPRGLALGADGTLFVAEYGRDRVRRIGPDGRISTTAGGGEGDSPATAATLDGPTDVAVDEQGTLYIADSLNGRVLSVPGTGELETIGSFGQPYGIDVGEDGTVYVSDRLRHIVRRIDADGTVTPFAGTGRGGGEGDGGAPLQAQLSFPEDVTLAPDGSVHIADTGNQRIRRAAPGLPGFTDSDFSLPSEDGTEVYMFDQNGRHLRTVEALTGALKWAFGYDAEGRLIRVADGYDNVTTIERDGGVAKAIVAPGGIRTELGLSADGWLETITNPADETITLGYHPGGLLASLTDPLGKTAAFTYDAAGRLETDRDKRGKTQSFERTPTASGFKVVRTSPENRKTEFETATLPSGDVRTTTTEPSGAQSTVLYGQDGVSRMTAANGTVTETRLGADPRWGMRAPIPTTITKTTPDGRRKVVERERTVVLGQAADPFDVEELTDVFTIDGRSHTRIYDGAARTLTTETAQGRTLTQRFDGRGRLVERGYGDGVEPIEMTYDDLGRLTAVTQGTARRTYGYDAAKPFRVVTRTDAEDRTVTYGYDDAERVTSITMPSTRTYEFGYDGNGNRTSITMPNGKVHGFGYDESGTATSYTPPGAQPWERDFDGDRLLAGLTLPGGHTATNVRDAAGRKDGITYGGAEGSTDFVLDGDDVEVEATRTLPGRSDTERTTRDGTLALARELSDAGGVYATHAYEYGADHELDAIETAGVRTEIERDGDALPTKFGPFALTRGGPVGRVSRIEDDALALDIAWDARGRAGGRTLTVAGQERYASELTWDDSNRVVAKTETVAGQTRTYTYAYSEDGELLSDGTGVTHTYDEGGNRTTGGAVYHDDDTLDRIGATDYTFDAAGFLTARGSDTFAYSTAGELLEATVGGTTVRYAYDTLGRRVARIVGADVTRYLYGNPAAPYQVTVVRAPDGTLSTLYYGRGDTLFAIRRGDDWFYVGTDEVGTPKVVTDADGAVVKTLRYSAFGVREAATGTFELPIGFAGGLEDPLTGLVRFGQRDYDPAAGRWTARDPILQAGGLNVYAYVNSNPVSHRDPSGLAEGGGFMGFLQSVGEYFTDGDGGTAVEAISQIESDSPVVEGAKTLTDGMDKLETIQDVADTALEVKEALDEPTDPEQAAGLLKCGLKWIKKILPVELMPTEAAEQALDQGMEHSRHQRDFGTINRGAASQMAQIEW